MAEIQETRPGDWNCTVTGGEFWPLDPRADDVDIVDIAHALSHVCRFAGHTQEFYSVAQHSVLVADLAAELVVNLPVPMPVKLMRKIALTGLLHDAGEAYVGDMTRPLKRCEPMGPMFCEIEDRIYKAVAERYDTFYPLPETVKLADNILLVTEVRDLHPALARRAWGRPNVQSLAAQILPWTSKIAKEQFLRRFKDFTEY